MGGLRSPAGGWGASWAQAQRYTTADHGQGTSALYPPTRVRGIGPLDARPPTRGAIPPPVSVTERRGVLSGFWTVGASVRFSVVFARLNVDADTLSMLLPWAGLVLLALVAYLVGSRALQGAVTRAAEELLRRQADAVLATRTTPERVSLPLVEEPQGASGRCETCNHFDLSSGQRTMAAHPAFQAAAAVLPPWQMARERKVRPNPEYAEVETQLREAQAAGDVERSRELHDRLLTLDPGEVLPDTEQVERSMLELDWAGLGACGLHRELRFATDRCESYETEV